MAGVPGVPPADVVIIGGGVVGTNAAKIAAGMGADVTILDVSPDRMRELDDIFFGRVKTIASNAQTLEEGCRRADLLVGAVLIPGAAAPKLVDAKLVTSKDKTHNTLVLKGKAEGKTYCRAGQAAVGETILVHIVVEEADG